MSEWIRVEDEIPEDGEAVLTYWTDGMLEVVYMDRDSHNLFEGTVIANAVLTHWMPLPDSPE